MKSTSEVTPRTPRKIEASNFRKFLQRAVAIPAILMVILAVALLWQIDRLLSLNRWVDQSDQAIAKGYTTQKLLLDMQSGMRGFLLTAQPYMFTPYVHAEPIVEQSFDELAALAPDNEIQRRQISAIRQEYSRWRDYSTNLIALKKSGGNYQDLRANLAEDQSMDTMRIDLTMFIEAEQGLRDIRVEETRVAARNSTIITLFLVFALGLLLIYFSRRQMLALSRSYQSALEESKKQAEVLIENSRVIDENAQLLRASEERSRSTFQQAAVGIGDVGLDGKWLSANRKLCAILRFTEDELRGRKIADIADQSDSVAMARILNDLYEGRQQGGQMETRFTRADRSVVWVNLTASLIRKSNGEPDFFVFIVEDTTERRIIELALKRTEERYRELFENANDIVFTHDQAGNLTSINRAVESLLGYSAPELAGVNMNRLVATGRWEPCDWGMRSISTGSGTSRFEAEFVAKSGALVPVEVSVRVIFEEGAPVGLQGIARDVTERKQMEKAIRASELKYRGLFEQAGDAILLVAAESKSIIEANDKACEVYGLARDSLSRAGVSSGFPRFEHSYDDLGLSEREKSIAEPALHLGDIELVHKRPDGRSVYILASSSPIEYDGARAILSIHKDITARKLEEQSIKQGLANFTAFMSKAADGDLTVRGPVSDDHIGVLTAQVNAMLDRFSEIIRKVRELALLVSSASLEMRSASEETASGARIQCAQLEAASNAVIEMAKSMRQVSNYAKASSDMSHNVLTIANRGGQSVARTSSAITGVQGAARELAQRMKSLSQRSDQISEITGLISGIASQTNLLSLNAAIEAAHAGESGAGFSVVAEEIRKLAEGSARASKDIASLIKIVQNEISDALVATHSGLAEVEQGSKLSGEASASIEEISLVVRRSASLAEEIAIASENQSHATTTVADTMGQVSSLTLEASASTAQIAKNISGLAEMAEQLKETISRFRVGEIDPSNASQSKQVPGAPGYRTGTGIARSATGPSI